MVLGLDGGEGADRKIGRQRIAGQDQVALRVQGDPFHLVDLRAPEISAIHQRSYPRLGQVESAHDRVVIAERVQAVRFSRQGKLRAIGVGRKVYQAVRRQ